jgi:methylglutaconyl-CoA hydratase
MSIRTRERGPVLEVILDRPAARNAFDQGMIGQLRGLFERLAALPASAPGAVAAPGASGAPGPARPRAIVLRAEGPVFCAGADLEEMKRLGQASLEENLEAAREMGAMFRAIRACPAPVVARVQGPAFGGGVGLVCACDVVVAAPEARFAFTEVRLGLVAGVIAPLVLSRLGEAASRRCFLTGEPLDARTALRLGLVDRVAEGGLDQEVAAVVRTLLAGGPEAQGRIKQLVEGSVAIGFERSLEFTARMIAEARTGDEAQAALAAFLAKAPAPWAADADWPPPAEGGLAP